MEKQVVWIVWGWYKSDSQTRLIILSDTCTEYHRSRILVCFLGSTCLCFLSREAKVWISLSYCGQVAGDLLKQYQQKFQGGTLAVTWNYLRESMNSYLSQPNPVTARWESEDHLRDPNFQLDAFRVSVLVLWTKIIILLLILANVLGRIRTIWGLKRQFESENFQIR